MKISGRNIKHRLYSLEQLPMRLARAGHFRGHGVHSPFVYNLVRKVFMRRTFVDAHRELYDALTAVGVPHGRAMQLQNVMAYCHYEHFTIDAEPTQECQIAICTRSFDSAKIEAMYASARQSGSTLCIMSPYALPERQQTCRLLIEQHTSTSVDNRGYLLIFNNELPKQHFRV